MSGQDDNEREDIPRRSGANVGIAVAAIGLGLAAFVVSVIQGAPRELPGYALGWPLFLHVERALFAALVTIVAGVVARRMLRGDELEQVGAAGAQMKFAEATRDPLVALKEAVDEGLKDIDARLLRVEQEVAEVDAEPSGEARDGE